MKRIALCLVFGLLTSAALAPIARAQQAAPGERDVVIGQRLSMTSEILGEDRAYWVYLPESYRGGRFAAQSYPVLYLLDGDAHFHSVSGLVQFMSAGINGNMQTPEMIVVAIPNTNRTRDLTPTKTTLGFDGNETTAFGESGGGDEFLRFIRQELIPEIESAYRTRPHRLLVGHSFGGLLALHALMAAPDLFQSYVAIDPSLWWDDQLLVRQAERYFSERSDLAGSVYITLANNPPREPGAPRIMKLAGEAFARSMEGAESSRFRTGIRYFEGEDHGSVPLISLYHGLLHTFEGYKPSLAAFVEDPSLLGSHFEQVSERLGMEFLPPERIVNQLGYALLQQDATKAIDAFKLNTTYYPESYNAYDSLGEAYAAAGETDLAIESYEMSLTLNPENSNASERLVQLRSGGR